MTERVPVLGSWLRRSAENIVIAVLSGAPEMLTLTPVVACWLAEAEPVPDVEVELDWAAVAAGEKLASM